jgi:enoyl-CoA hydratase
MPGSVELHAAGADGVARVVLRNPGKRGAVDIAMWQRLRELFEALQQQAPATAPRVVIVSGEGGDFASGGDIAEFAGFRFDEERLCHFHEEIVAPALHALLACEIPLLAQIEGACLGGGLEIAACCDIRIAAAGSRFGAPIARLGFPMAPQELQLVTALAGQATVREMLLEARLLDAAQALARGLVHAVVPESELAARALERARAIAALAPGAARINKRTLRQIAAGGPTAEQRRAHFVYAPADEHREGIAAFIEKRPPRF